MDAAYLFAIQSLNGQNPGDKYKELHSIASQIIKDDKERAEFTNAGLTDRVQPAILPYLRILVGNKLKLNEIVIEALKSDDVTIVKQALNAKWFFDSSNAHIQAEYFVKNVVPFISTRTRLELIKILAHHLIDDPKKANDFFGTFADLYGLQQALPLVTACSEEYIFQAVLQRQIVFPTRILSVLYRKYPQLVIRYLQLGNKDNKNNKDDRKLHKISLSQYAGFLPVLVKYHTQEFVELCQCLNNYYNTKLGSTRAEYFLKNATDILISKPTIFLNTLPLKLVSNKLSSQQFETMYENLFPKSIDDFCPTAMIEYLKYYPHEKKLSLLQEKYKLKYNKDLLDREDILRIPEFYELLPPELKEMIFKKNVAPLRGMADYQDKLYYLPPSESISLLMESLGKPSEKSRSHWFVQMIKSCAIYNSKENLLEVLTFYNKRHKNERVDVLSEVLVALVNNFEIKSLDKEHWQVLKEIIQRAYVKADLFAFTSYLWEKIFKGALVYFIKKCKNETADSEDKIFLEKLILIIIESYCEHNMKWNFIIDYSEIKKDCLELFLNVIPNKYPVKHAMWSKSDNKLNLMLVLLEGMNEYNTKNFGMKTKKKYKTYQDSKGSEISQRKFTINNYPWLVLFARDLLKTIDDTGRTTYDSGRYDYKSQNFEKFRELLIKVDPKTYQNIIDEDPNLINDVRTKDALAILKYDRNKILAKWSQYLYVSRKLLSRGYRSVKQFINATKWHQEIPVKFAEQCLLEIQKKGSIYVLGILLDGQSLGKIIEPYLPKGNKMEIDEEDAKETYEITSRLPTAINSTNPPVSFDVIATFCQGDYVSLASRTLTNFAKRVPVKKLLEYAHQMLDKPISVKKLGIRLVLQVSTKYETVEFLTQLWKNESNLSIRELIANTIFDVFKQTPNTETWELIKICISELTTSDKTIFKNLARICNVDKNYVSLYIQELLKKIDTFNIDNFDDQTKTQILDTLVTEIDGRTIHFLSEELLSDIIGRRFIEYPPRFLIKTYLLSDKEKSDERLKLFMNYLREELKKFNQPDLKNPRYYPINQKICQFFKNTIYSLIQDGEDGIKLKVIYSLSELFPATLQPWQESQTYISLSLLKEWYELKVPRSPKEFGVKYGKIIETIIKKIANEIIIQDIAETMNQINFQTDSCKNEFTLSFIEGLMESNVYYGSLLGINLINHYEIKNYDERYDKFMKMWREDRSNVIQAALSKFMNNMPDWIF